MSSKVSHAPCPRVDRTCHLLLQAAPVGAGTNQRSAAAGAVLAQGGALPPPPPPAAGWGTQQQRPEPAALRPPAFAPVDPQNAPSALLGQTFCTLTKPRQGKLAGLSMMRSQFDSDGGICPRPCNLCPAHGGLPCQSYRGGRCSHCRISWSSSHCASLVPCWSLAASTLYRPAHGE